MRLVIPSLGYADMLAVVLPAWKRFLPSAGITVVTAEDDHETQAIARDELADLCVTDAWSRDGAVLNKAAALDVAFGITTGYRGAPPLGELCLALDCDVMPFGRFPREETLRPAVLYGCSRYACDTPADLEAHQAGRTPRESLSLIAPKCKGRNYVPIANTPPNALACARRCLGYFQLFRYRRGLCFGSFPTAAKYDLEFRRQFPMTSGLWDCYVLHLGESDRENWKGRILPTWGAAAPALEEAARG